MLNFSMARKKRAGYSPKTVTGGILVAVLWLLLFFTSALLILMDNYRLTRTFSEQTSRYYEARIMKDLFLAAGPPTSLSGEKAFNNGSLTYQKLPDNRLKIHVKVKGLSFQFEESFKNEEEQSTIETGTTK